MPHSDQRVRVRIRQRPDQNAINNAENRRVSSDPDCERRDNRERHRRSSTHGSQAESDISPPRFKHWNSSLIAIHLLCLDKASKIAPGCPSSLFLRQTTRAMLELERLQVVTKLSV